MSQEVIPNLDAMASAFMHSANDSKIIVKAEELPQEGGGIDYSKHFFEPQVGKSYTIKFITNPFGDQITHRKIYKNLPDPKRKGKRFQYVSSGSAKTCKVLEAFFELHGLKKENNALAIQKLDEYMGVTNQACAIIQVLSSDDPKEIGMYRMFTFSTYGPNPTIANMLNTKLNPTDSMIKNGFTKEDIFNIFESSVLILECEESEYEGKKGRDFGKSIWAPNKRGAFIKWVDETGQEKMHEFSNNDIVDGQLTPDAKIAFGELVKVLSNPDLSVHNYFGYKTIGDTKNTEETEKYLKDVQDKVDEIIPIILKAQSIADIANYGVAIPDAPKNNDSATLIGGVKASDILKDSIPNELAASIMNTETPVAATENPIANNPVADAISSNPDVAAILAAGQQ